MLTEKQLQKAKENFLQGHENLLPFIENSYSDYYDFYKIISDKYNFDYGSINYMLNEQLIVDNIDKYDEQKIMDYFIKMIESDE